MVTEHNEKEILETEGQEKGVEMLVVRKKGVVLGEVERIDRNVTAA